MCLASEFQRVGAAMRMTLSPQVWCLVVTGGEGRLDFVKYGLQDVSGSGARRWGSDVRDCGEFCG